MIIVFGKETRAKLLDCAAYIAQCRTQFEKDKVHPLVIKDCGELSDWLFKVGAGRMLRMGRWK